MPYDILIIEDDIFICDALSMLLQKEGHNIDTANTVVSADLKINQSQYDLLILDNLLPDGKGFDLCRKIRAKEDLTPIIIITACDDEAQIIEGLEAGADDYITKPFSTKVLFSRIKAVLRRNKQSGYYSAGFAVDYANMTVKKDGQNIMLTPTEFRLLNVLLKNKGVIVTRDSLLKEIWDDYEYYIDNNTLSVHMSRLREKIGSENISTIRGVGYRWED